MSPLMLAMASMACPLAGQYELGLRNHHAGHHSASWSRSTKHRQWIASNSIANSNQTLLPAIVWINATSILWIVSQTFENQTVSMNSNKNNVSNSCDCFDYWTVPAINFDQQKSEDESFEMVVKVGDKNYSLWNSYWKFYGRMLTLLVLNCYFSVKLSKK